MSHLNIFLNMTLQEYLATTEFQQEINGNGSAGHSSVQGEVVQVEAVNSIISAFKKQMAELSLKVEEASGVNKDTSVNQNYSLIDLTVGDQVVENSPGDHVPFFASLNNIPFPLAVPKG